VRGEEVISVDNIDTRLSLLALVESMVRHGSQDWTCSAFVASSSESILKEIVSPNLVWRVGRVEATMRKVAISIAHAVLKTGSVTVETLVSTAGMLIPSLVSHLDDTDISIRLIACLCLNSYFYRLIPAETFSSQSINELYPKLLKRLDDSNDEIRQAICLTLSSFFSYKGTNQYFYNSTCVDYSLDQLFIHLDDPDEKIQESVKNTILSLKHINSDLILKKAETNKNSHRTPTLCLQVINSLQC
jgi:dynein assembly factor 5